MINTDTEERNKIVSILKSGKKRFIMDDISKLSQLPYVGPPRVTEDTPTKKPESKRSKDIQALALARVYDPITYVDFLRGLGNTPLNKIKRSYGETVVEDTRNYFVQHPSPRFIWIQNGCKGPEPGGDICQR